MASVVIGTLSVNMHCPFHAMLSEVACWSAHVVLQAMGHSQCGRLYRNAILTLPGLPHVMAQDLYVMRRAVGVYEALVRRFTAQTTDYQR